MVIRVGLQFDSGGLGLELLVHVAGPWRIHAPAFPLPFWFVDSVFARFPLFRGLRTFSHVLGLSQNCVFSLVTPSWLPAYSVSVTFDPKTGNRGIRCMQASRKALGKTKQFELGLQA